MKRNIERPRENWQEKVEEVGLIYHTPEGRTYWDESASYRFTAKEVDIIEAATEALHTMCLNAAQHIIDNDLFDQMAIPKAAISMIKAAWEAEPPALHGRFDLAYDGMNPPKMLEFNADTPTGLVEASLAQWYWMKDKHNADQFNSIHEKLLAKFTELNEYIDGERLYFASIDDAEDAMTVTYLRDLAGQAGIRTEPIRIEDIGLRQDLPVQFVDLQNRPIRSIYKLYPWEWMFEEKFGQYLPDVSMQWIEPVWKMLLSNKGILPILWKLYPNHPNLLPAYFAFEKPPMTDYCRKPLYSREGRNITLRKDGKTQKTDGNYGGEGYIFQAIAPIPSFDGKRPVIGSWYVLDQGPAGMGIRESDGEITDNLSRFVPHYF